MLKISHLGLRLEILEPSYMYTFFQEYSWWQHSKHRPEGHGQHCLWIRYVRLQRQLLFQTKFIHLFFCFVFQNIKYCVLHLAVKVPRCRGLWAELQWLHQRCVCQVFKEATARWREDHRGAGQSCRGWEETQYNKSCATLQILYVRYAMIRVFAVVLFSLCNVKSQKL